MIKFFVDYQEQANFPCKESPYYCRINRGIMMWNKGSTRMTYVRSAIMNALTRFSSFRISCHLCASFHEIS